MALDAADLAARVLAAVPSSEARALEGTLSPTILIRPGEMPAVLTCLRDLAGLEFKLFVDATAIDLEPAGGGLEVVYIVRSIVDWSSFLVVKTLLDPAAPAMPTSAAVYAGAIWAEREIYDMFGVVFEGHPDPRRILMYPEFEGHPLRKSYPYQKRQPLTPERDPLHDPWPKRG